MNMFLYVQHLRTCMLRIYYHENHDNTGDSLDTIESSFYFGCYGYAMQGLTWQQDDMALISDDGDFV